MNGLRRLAFLIASSWTRSLVLCAALATICLEPMNALAQELPPTLLSQPPAPEPPAQAPTVAQVPYTFSSQASQIPTTGAPFEPPLSPPGAAVLPSPSAVLSLGQWLLTPTLALSTLYDSNIYSSPTAPLRGPGLHVHPALSADYNTGIWDTTLYGNIDSTVYPTLDYQNNTFNREAGIIQKYSPLPDLVFSVQGDYTHNTAASVLVNALPAALPAPGLQPPAGAAGVVATQQTVVNPNDVYTAQATIAKTMNRAFITLNGSVATTQYQQNSNQNLNTATYDGTGGFWLTPLFYAFGDGVQSFTNPEVGLPSNSFRARGGIGSDRIGLFQGFVYYGQQGSEVYGSGKAGGDIYGGAISYFPTDAWNMSFAVDRLRNISDITGGALGLGGLPFVPVGVGTNQSLQITTLTFKSNYTFSPQTTGHVVVSYSVSDQIGGLPLQVTTWLADIGIQHQIRNDLSLTFDYQYSSLTSPTPQTSFIRNLVTLGANYSF